MAEFCTKCAPKLDFPIDIDCKEILESLPTDHYLPVMCEGCGLSALGNFNGEYKAAYWIESGKATWVPYEVEK